MKLRLAAIFVVLAALLAAQFGSALAAPAAQTTTPITGTVQSITLEDQNGVTVVHVTILTQTGTQDILLSVDSAVSLGLVNLDPATNQPVVNDGAINSTVTIDPALELPTEPLPEGQTQHPVGSALADFFSALLGVDYNQIMEVHDEGVGFGVIAQALWMTKKLEGDGALFTAIIEAKQSGDYSAITMPDGSTPTNRGQFRKALLQGDRKANLGQIMSGHAVSPENGSAPAETLTHGNGNQKDKNKGHGNGHRP